MALKFETPPPATRGRGSTKWSAIFAELRANPGEWALVSDSCSSTQAVSVKKGRYGGAEPGEFEATTRKNPDGTFRLYVQYPAV